MRQIYKISDSKTTSQQPNRNSVNLDNHTLNDSNSNTQAQQSNFSTNDFHSKEDSGVGADLYSRLTNPSISNQSSRNSRSSKNQQPPKNNSSYNSPGYSSASFNYLTNAQQTNTPTPTSIQATFSFSKATALSPPPSTRVSSPSPTNTSVSSRSPDPVDSSNSPYTREEAVKFRPVRSYRRSNTSSLNSNEDILTSRNLNQRRQGYTEQYNHFVPDDYKNLKNIPKNIIYCHSSTYDEEIDNNNNNVGNYNFVLLL